MHTETHTRRTILQAGAGVATSSIALASTGAVRAQASFGGWLSNTDNYDGVVDERGSESVTIEVGSEANGGNFGFSPAAVRVDPGTTVTWEWVAGSHNVVDDAGNFESELTSEEGHTFSQTFEETGVVKYYCLPHDSMGMRGVVVVGDATVNDASGSDTSGQQQAPAEDTTGTPAETDGETNSERELTTRDWATVGTALAVVTGLLSPLAFVGLGNRDSN